VLIRKQGGPKKAPGAAGAEKKATGSRADVLGLVESTRNAAPVPVAGGATYTTEVDTAHDRDQRALMELAIKAQQEGASDCRGLLGSRVQRDDACCG
jgi:hypothetical protein